MFWKKKVPAIKKGKLNILENAIINYLLSRLKPHYREQLKIQLEYLKYLRRINYRNDCALELYPKGQKSVPASAIFERKEEFCLGTIKFNINNEGYWANIYCVLGWIFEIRIAPIPQNINNVKENEIFIKSAEIERDFDDRAHN